MLKRHAALLMFILGLLSLGLAWYELRQETCGPSSCVQAATGYACTSDLRCSI